MESLWALYWCSSCFILLWGKPLAENNRLTSAATRYKPVELLFSAKALSLKKDTGVKVVKASFSFRQPDINDVFTALCFQLKRCHVCPARPSVTYIKRAAD